MIMNILSCASLSDIPGKGGYYRMIFQVEVSLAKWRTKESFKAGPFFYNRYT